MKHYIRGEKPGHGLEVGDVALFDDLEFVVDAIYGDVVYASRDADRSSPAMGERVVGFSKITTRWPL